jgi:oxygen-independent coproporphyrinogen-3 oxidase
MTLNIPLSLYIHIPWCVRKCPYCDFNSHALRKPIPEKEYIDALLTDLANDYPLVKNRQLHSIFIGGGTPSLFKPASFATLLAGIKNYFELTPNLEITLEANPGTVEQDSFSGFREAGINRLSLGIQSLQDEKLKALGRIHSAEEAIRAVEIAKQAGFDNFNLDLMHGLPKQTLSDALYDLETALSLNPTHLSWYQLTLEPNTLFYKQPPVLPNDDLRWEIQEQGQKILANCGYAQYEVSAYAQPEKQCQHNLNYWLFGDYLGIGAGAHGKITDLSSGEIRRISKHKQPRDYLQAAEKNTSFIADTQIVEPKEISFEFMLNTLRLNQSIPLSLFTERTGMKVSLLKDSLQQAQDQGLIRIENEHIIKTELGSRFLNNLIELFL